MRNLFFGTCFLAVATVVTFLICRSPALDRPPPPAKDSFKHLPVENDIVFHAMGVHVIKVHIPAEQLIDKKKIELRLTMPGELPRTVSGPIRYGRREELPLDLTVVIQFDDMDRDKAQRLNVSLWGSNEFYVRTTFGLKTWFTDIEGIGILHSVGDIRNGVQLFDITQKDRKITLKDDLGKLVFTLWAV